MFSFRMKATPYRLMTITGKLCCVTLQESRVQPPKPVRCSRRSRLVWSRPHLGSKAPCSCRANDQHLFTVPMPSCTDACANHAVWLKQLLGITKAVDKMLVHHCRLTQITGNSCRRSLKVWGRTICSSSHLLVRFSRSNPSWSFNMLSQVTLCNSVCKV